MIKFATAQKSAKPRGKYADFILYGYAVILVVMAVAQLYAFEDFVPLLDSFGFTIAQAHAYILAAALVTSEVFALPFLLKMYVSPLFRVTSMVLAWLAPLLWVYIISAVFASVNAVQDAGFLGGAVTVPFGWWCLVFAYGMVGLAAWSTWSLWPFGELGSSKSQGNKNNLRFRKKSKSHTLLERKSKK